MCSPVDYAASTGVKLTVLRWPSRVTVLQRVYLNDSAYRTATAGDLSHEICDSKKLRGLFQRGSAFQVSTLQRYGRTVLICKRFPYPHDRSRTHDGRKRTAAPPASGDLTRGRAGNHDHDQDVADDKAA